MPQVPYTPYPTVSPSEQNAPEFRPQVVPGAFGAGMGQAISHLGGQLEHSGDEIFRTALQLRKDQIETEVNAATTQYMENTAKAREQFLTLQGTNASPQALDKFMGSIRGDREAMRAQIGSSYGQRMFDNQTRVELARAYTSGVVHAARQVEKAHIEGLNARKSALEASRLASPDDEEHWNNTGNEIKGITREIARRGGQEPGTADMQIQAWEHEQNAKRALQLKEKDPWKAGEFADSHRGQLGEHEATIDRQIEDKKVEVSTRSITAEVTGPIWTKEKGEISEQDTMSMVKAAKEKMEVLMPRNQKAQQAVTQGVEGEVRRFNIAYNEGQRRAYNIALSAALGQDDRGKELPYNPDGLRLKGEHVSKAYDSLQPALKNKIDRQLETNGKGNYPESPQTDKKFREWQGLAEYHPDEFVKKVGGWNDDKLPKANRDWLWGKYWKIERSGAARGPLIGHAITVLRNNGVITKDELKADNDSDNAFTGSLYRAMQTHIDLYKKPPNDEEILKYGRALTFQTAEGTWFRGLAGNISTYQVPVTEEYKNLKRAAFPAITEEEIKKAWIQDQMVRQLKKIENAGSTGRANK